MKVLFITLSNIGDAVLTTPAITAILENFKDAEITLMVSPRVAGLFKGDPHFEQVIVYKKDAPLGKKMALIKSLRAIEFDLLVDFKDTMLPFLLYAKKKTPILKKAPPCIVHMRDKHLWKLRQTLPQILNADYKPNIWISDETLTEVDEMFKANGIRDKDVIVAVAPGARSHTKQWTKEGFTDVCRRLIEELSVKVVLIGDQQDSKISSQISEQIGSGVIDLCGMTSLKHLAGVLKKSALLITNDSAPMHIAWAVQTPVVAIFGPSNHEKYRPLGPKDIVIREKLQCSPCQLALCRTDNECMKLIPPDRVFQAARRALTSNV